jgi:hypothetical protein
MRIDRHFVSATVLVVTLMGRDGRPTAAVPKKTLVLQGTVTSISTIDDPLTPWIVTIAVTKVISGKFVGSTFQFAIHSPARAGLKEGSSYTIEAVWKEGGYTVDETQWRRQKRRRIWRSPEEPVNPSLHRTGPGVG